MDKGGKVALSTLKEEEGEKKILDLAPGKSFIRTIVKGVKNF